MNSRFTCKKSHGYAVAFLLFPILTSASELSLSIGQERWLYREFGSQSEELDREQGWLGHYQASLELNLDAQNSLHFNYSQAQGRLDYVGQTQNDGTPLYTQTDERSLRASASLRHDFGYFSLGLGALKQSWDRDIEPGIATNGEQVAGLYEHYRWSGPLFELGTALAFAKFETQLWISGAVLSGDMQIDLTAAPVNGQVRNYGKPIMQLKNGHEFSSVLELRYWLDSRWLIFFSHQQSLRTFPKSNSVRVQNGLSAFYVHEPKSTQYLQSLNLGLGWAF